MKLYQILGNLQDLETSNPESANNLSRQITALEQLSNDVMQTLKDRILKNNLDLKAAMDKQQTLKDSIQQLCIEKALIELYHAYLDVETIIHTDINKPAYHTV